MALPDRFLAYSFRVVTLEQSGIFQRLTPEQLRGLRLIAEERSFAADQVIFNEGDPGDGVYLVKHGRVEIWVTGEANVRQVFRQIEPGELFGEMAVLEDKPRSANAMAKEATVVYFLPRQAMLELVQESAGVSLALLREISGRLREFNGQYLREVLQAERLAVVGRFARSIIHDLKNPLNVIGLTADMAAMAGIPEDTRQQAMQTIREQVECINEMVAEVLDFTQGDHSDVIMPPMDFSYFMRYELETLRLETSRRQVKLEVENEPPQVSLLLNPKRLRRVFHNLVHNSTEAMPSGGRIMLRFQATPEEVVTEIEDTGPGIAPAIAQRLFEPFATFGKVHGTGLGLSICKRIVEDHHGWIKTRIEPGRGAIFAFGLPRADAPPA